MMLSLPLDVFNEIASYCDALSIYVLKHTCKTFKSLVGDRND